MAGTRDAKVRTVPTQANRCSRNESNSVGGILCESGVGMHHVHGSAGTRSPFKLVA